MPECACLVCAAPLDSCNTQSGGTPSPGDLSLCVYCGNIAAFGDDLQLRAIPQEEYRALPENIRIEIEGARAIIRSSKHGGPWKRGSS